MATIDELASDSFESIEYARIEGIGYNDGGTMKAVWLWTNTPPTGWTPDSTRYDVLGLEHPGNSTQSCDVFGGVATQSDLTIEVADFPQQSNGRYFFAELFATGRWNAEPVTYPQTYLTATLAQSTGASQTLTVKNTADFPSSGYLYVGKEAIQYTGKPTSTTFTGCTRGKFSPTANPHVYRHVVKGGKQAFNPIVASRPFSLAGRLVTVWQTHPRSTSESESLRRYTGTIQAIDFNPTTRRWRIVLASILRGLDSPLCWQVGNISSDNTVGQSPLLGITLPSPRTVHGFVDDGNDLLYTITATMNASYESFGAMVSDLNSKLRAASHTSPSTEVVQWSARLLTQRDGVTQDAPHVAIYATRTTGATSAVKASCTLSPTMAQVLGFSEIAEQVVLPGRALVGGGADAPYQAQFHAGLDKPYDIFVRLGQGATDLLVDSSAPFIVPGGGFSGAVEIGGQIYAAFNGKSTTPHKLTATPLTTLSTGYGNNNRGMSLTYRASDDGGGSASDAPLVRQVYAQTSGAGAGGACEQGPCRLMLEWLLWTGADTYGSAYDATSNGAIPGVGLGLSPDLVDVASFEAVSQEITYRDRAYVIKEPTPARTLIEAECQFIGAVVVIKEGKISLRLLRSVGALADAVATLDEHTRFSETDHTAPRQSPATVLNSLTIAYDVTYSSGDPQTTANIVDADSQVALGSSRKLDLLLRGVHDSGGSSQAGIDAAIGALTARQQLYRFPLWHLRRTINRRLHQRLLPGDIVKINDGSPPNTGVPDPFTGDLGLVDRLGIVTSISEDIHGAAGQVEVLLFQQQASDATGIAPLAPSALLDWSRGDGGWDDGNKRIYCRASEYSNPASPITKDVGHFLANYKLRVTRIDQGTPDTSATTGIVTVTSGGPDTTNNYIPIVEDLDTVLGTAIVVGALYVVTFADYETAGLVAAQKTEGTFIADDADDGIGSTSNRYHYW